MAAYTSTQNGNWNDVNTWGGGGSPDTNADTATIGHEVTYNLGDSAITFNNVTINSSGVLIFPTASDSTLLFDTTGILTVNSGDYGDICTASVKGSGSYVITDKTKGWNTSEWQNHKIIDSIGNRFNASDNTETTLTITTGSTFQAGAYDIYRYNSNNASIINASLRQLVVSASPGMAYTTPVEKFVLPVYECYYAQDSLGLEESSDFNLEPNDNYGAYYSGTIEFIQKGTGT